MLTGKESRRYKGAREAFRRVLQDLRPLHQIKGSEEEFYGLFQSVEVLPRCLYEQYKDLQSQKQFLLASQLLVPIPLGTFHMLKEKKCIHYLQSEGLFLAAQLLMPPA